MLFELSYMPLVTKATRITYHSKTLIDHIYTNAKWKISAARPTFGMNMCPLLKKKKTFFTTENFDGLFTN